ncbi:hypothetical protein PIB30_044830 [Stylosanthes scabra]|uniref:Uncharacterized protein n=1 Tax=Stylosanthes scabra TaxID=79078 RepID=A0ABU6WFX3_9FABA|nr:hypothetical protein [Stylosanthes scabra]
MATLVRKKIAAYAPCSRRSRPLCWTFLPTGSERSEEELLLKGGSPDLEVWVEDRRLRARANKRPEPEKKSLEADDCASRRGLLSCHLFLIIIRISPLYLLIQNASTSSIVHSMVPHSKVSTFSICHFYGITSNSVGSSTQNYKVIIFFHFDNLSAPILQRLSENNSSVPTFDLVRGAAWFREAMFRLKNGGR